jgi:hypothetical protein
MSILVVLLNYSENKKRNKLEIITKSDMMRLSELRIIFSNYIQNINSMIKEKYDENYFRIKLYLNTKNNAANAVLEKIELCNDTVNYILDSKQHFKNNLNVLTELSDIQIKKMNKALEMCGLQYKNIEEIKDAKLLSTEETIKICNIILCQLNDQLKNDEALLNSAINSLSKILAKEDDRLNSFKNNYAKRIEEINSKLKTYNTKVKGSLFSLLPKSDGDFNEYLKTIIRDTTEAINEYLDMELLKIINSVK